MKTILQNNSTVENSRLLAPSQWDTGGNDHGKRPVSINHVDKVIELLRSLLSCIVDALSNFYKRRPRQANLVSLNTQTKRH